MSNICKTVSLRTRKIKDGHMLSYYLDYYPGYRDESTMKVIRHESLGIYIYAKPKNQTEQKYNLNLMARAEAIRCRRFEAIVNERYDFFDKEKMKGDFLAYFKRLADKKNSKWVTFFFIDFFHSASSTTPTLTFAPQCGQNAVAFISIGSEILAAVSAIFLPASKSKSFFESILL